MWFTDHMTDLETMPADVELDPAIDTETSHYDSYCVVI